MPSMVDQHVSVGEARSRQGLHEEAIEAFRAALELEPRHVDACRQIAQALEACGRTYEAAHACCCLAVALEQRDEFPQAAAAYERALALEPQLLQALVGAGCAHMAIAQPREAIRYLEAALAIEPTHARAHQSLGWAYALIGDLERNWEEIAWYDAHGPWLRFAQPKWSGESLHGKTILLWINAALGDTLMLVRFAPRVKALGARVILECDRVLVPLLRQLPCLDQVVARHTPLPPFDTHALLASLPRMFRTGWAAIPSDTPYLFADPPLVERWADRLGPRDDSRIGLVWAGAPGRVDARVRYAPLAAFAPLANMPGVRFISLQLGPQAAERLTPPEGLQIDDLLDNSSAITDTAALLMQLDLVITVDTMIAHLAGALGREVWTLLPHAADWRWMEGKTTPWYPTMRLFRQARAGDWVDLLHQVRGALDQWIASRTYVNSPVRARSMT
jgi:hypothetical protein